MPADRQILIRLTEDEHARVAEIAAAQRRTLGSLAAFATMTYVDDQLQIQDMEDSTE